MNEDKIDNSECVPHARTLRKNPDGSYSCEVRILIYLDDGTTLSAVRNVRFSDVEIE